MNECYPEWYAKDNAFRSLEWMEKLHSPLVDLAQSFLDQPGASIIDLGCGNAALLKSISKAAPGSIPFGIDSEADSIEHAKILLPEHAENLYCANLLDEAEYLWIPGRIFTVAILMPGHLLLGPRTNIDRLKRRLAEQCRHVIAYCYQDWILRFGSLEILARTAGLTVRPVFSNDRVRNSISGTYLRVDGKSGN